MTPADLYAKPPVEISTDLWKIQPVIESDLDRGWSFDKNTRVDLAIWADVDFDGERGWRLCAVRLDGMPFMIVQQAGRGMQDHSERFITDRALFDQAIAYLRTLSGGDGRPDDVVDPDSDIEGLDSFYGEKLDFYYANPPLTPAYAVGDTVVVRVMENPHRDCYAANPRLIETRVLITEVNPRQPIWTYQGAQIDRKSEWKGIGHPPVIVDAPGGGEMHARFADTDVVGPASPEPRHPNEDQLLRRFRST